jgi:hypothetical protein
LGLALFQEGIGLGAKETKKNRWQAVFLWTGMKRLSFGSGFGLDFGVLVGGLDALGADLQSGAVDLPGLEIDILPLKSLDVRV